MSDVPSLGASPLAPEFAMDPAILFPHLKPFHIVAVRADPCRIAVSLRTRGRTARCPLCHRRSRRVRSTYTRTLADLSCGGTPVALIVRVRRFRCRNARCPRRIFAERLPTLAAPYARQTDARRDALQRIGMALGGNAGVRLALPLGLPTSRAALLRLVRAAPLDAPAAAQVLGVDEWAWRRGDRYGTILVDLVAHRPLALLPDRSAGSAAALLRTYPHATIVCRDRSGLYADAITAGAPTAIQVADRWHLLKNLGDALERFLLGRSASTREAARAMVMERAAEASAPAETSTMYQGKRQSSHDHEQGMEATSLARHARYVTAYERVHMLRRAGADIADIARTVDISRRTTYRYLRLPQPPERKRPRPRHKVIEPYLPYLLKRWDEGCHNGMRLWREIRAMGFAYSSTNVSRFVSHLRRGLPRPSARRSAVSRVDGPSARQAAHLLLRRPEDRTEEHEHYLAYLCRSDATIAAAHTLVDAFARMVRERQGDRLDGWLAVARESDITEIRGFARGLEGDLAAVRAGLTLPWSNGQTEGQINRLKLLKRQMYGRANVDLLRQRLCYRA